MTGYLEWLYAIHCLRLAHIAEGNDYWRDCTELYAAEAGPLFSAALFYGRAA